MKITANGQPVEVSDGLTVTQLLAELKVEMPEYVSVELNGEFVARKEFGTVGISEGDTVEFMYFMGGGG